MADLSGRVAIITGGGRGMGREMALAFARAGAAGITVTSAASPDEIAATAAELDAIAGRPCGLAVCADVADTQACERAVAETVERFGRLDILVNNAGKGMREVREGRDPFWKNDVGAWLSVIETNVNGPFLMSRAAAPHMVAAGFGRIINVSKTAQSMIGAANSPYGPSKAALDAMTLIWAQDLDGTGVTVNCLLPGGLTDTTFSRPTAVPRARAAGRPVYDPADMGPPALWLASEDSAAYTGCRFNAARWDAARTPAEAAEGAREVPIFAQPKRGCAIAAAWRPPGARTETP
ncbi:MAG: SDR family oxidoreductase [Alphaproteobacteria bacterium]|nr:SDR family oxidoreductase [Alphaproteobacteria bacterium]